MKLIRRLFARVFRLAVIGLLIFTLVTIVYIHQTEVGESFSVGPISYTRKNDFAGELALYDYVHTINPEHADNLLEGLEDAAATAAHLAAKAWSYCFPVLKEAACRVGDLAAQAFQSLPG